MKQLPDDALLEAATTALLLALKPGASEAALQEALGLLAEATPTLDDIEPLRREVMARLAERISLAVERGADKLVGLSDEEAAARAVSDLFVSAAQVN